MIHDFEYALLVSGNGFKTERFGNNIIERPESLADWIPESAVESDAQCNAVDRGSYEWAKEDSFKEPWQIRFNSIVMELHCSQSKNIGIFPEQLDNWNFIKHAIARNGPRGQAGGNLPNGKPISVLNLFAYTGAATLIAAQAGAQVCHVDSSRSTVTWAKKNAQLSGMEDKPIRWIVDDALAFAKREVKRGRRYEGIILDPPPFGHVGKKQFHFDNAIEELLDCCRQLLADDAAFFILNSYAMNLEAEELLPLVQKHLGKRDWETGSLKVKQLNSSNIIACSTYIRWQRLI